MICNYPKKVRIILFITLSIVLVCVLYSSFKYIQRNEKIRVTILYLAQDIVEPRQKKDLQLGSSTMARMDAKKHLSCGNWINRGIGNSQIDDISTYLSLSFLSVDPSKILLYAGDNDIAAGKSLEQTITEYKDLIQVLRNKYPESDIHILAVKPSPKRFDKWNNFIRLNQFLQNYASVTPKLYFHPQDWQQFFAKPILEFEKDGIHLSEPGNSALVREFNSKCIKTK